MGFYFMYDIILYHFNGNFPIFKVVFTCNVNVVSHPIYGRKGIGFLSYGATVNISYSSH